MMKSRFMMVALVLMAGALRAPLDAKPVEENTVSFNLAPGTKAAAVFKMFEESFGFVALYPEALAREPLKIRFEGQVTLDQFYDLLLTVLEEMEYYAVLDKSKRVLDIEAIAGLDKKKLRLLIDPKLEDVKPSAELVVAKLFFAEADARMVRQYLFNKVRFPSWVKLEVDGLRNSLECFGTLAHLRAILQEMKTAEKIVKEDIIQGVRARLFYLRYLKAPYAFQMLVDLMKLKEGGKGEGEGEGKETGQGKGDAKSFLKGLSSSTSPTLDAKGGEKKEGMRSAMGELPGGVQYQVYLDEMMNGIHVVAPLSILAIVEKFLQQVDIEPADRRQVPSLPRIQLFVLDHLEVSKAVELLSNLFRSLYGEKTRTMGPVQSAGQSPPVGGTGMGAGGEMEGPEKGIATGGVEGRLAFIADRESNNLMVFGPADDLELVAEAVKLLDKPSNQVLIEISAMEVNLTGDWQFGVAYRLTKQPLGSPQIGSFETEGRHMPAFSETTINNFSDYGDASVAVLTSAGLNALLKLLQKETKVAVLSVPRVMAQSNKQAEINVQDVDSYDTEKTNYIPVGTSYVPQKELTPVEIRTGLHMKVLPKINDQLQVLLNIQIDISEITGKPRRDGAPPPFTTRNVAISPMVKNGEVLFIGGIIKSRKEKTELKTPVLSALPLIGSLFSTTTENDVQRELVLFLTPHVLKGTEAIEPLMKRMRLKHPHIEWPDAGE